MKLSDFDYEIDNSKIAQHPYQKRDEAKLLISNMKDDNFVNTKFYDIINYFKKDDYLVLNDTKVIPARLFGKKEETNAKIELLLLKPLPNNGYQALAKPAKRLKVGDIINFSDILKAKLIEKKEDGICDFELIYEGNLYLILDKLGQMPLPPYIKAQVSDNSDYQTVYAKNLGSAAAPTAGFHFTDELLEKLKEKGVKIVKVTLHVGLGTFRPVVNDNISEHKMHSEYYEISEEAANLLNEAKSLNKRIIACGTTSVRTLESNFKDGKFSPKSEETNIYIYPGYEFKAVDGIITNFHLPKSSLIMLVSAFYNLESIKKMYKFALENDYLFFSFGDAMFIYKR